MQSKAYHVKIWKMLKLPLDNPSKQESQTMLHAIEELYFFRKYEEARKVADEVLKGKLNQDFRRIVNDYRGRCECRLKARNTEIMESARAGHSV